MEQIQEWKDTVLKNYLKKNGKDSIQDYEVSHIEDWMKSDSAKKYINRLNRISVPQAIQMSNSWTEKLNKKYLKNKNKENSLKGVKVVKDFGDGYFMVELESQESYEREGALMGHCAASYFEDDVILYSLRDSKNNPHCTIEFEHKKRHINQVKGKANKNVVKKYHKYIIQFLNEFDFKTIYTNDIKNINAINFGNNLIERDSLPSDLKVNKDLELEKVNFDHTFNSLIIEGDLVLEGNYRLTKLANNLVVKGDLELYDCMDLAKLCDKLEVQGSMEIIGCPNLIKLGDVVKVKGEMYIEECPRIKNGF
tara:strand:- start:6245 stop:7171 length:927 start_codon:yes stop_codon:yes gene_type:complete